MAFCTNCGAKLADDAKFCTECGAKVEPLPSEPVTEPVTTPAPASDAAPANDYTRPVSDYTYTPPSNGYTYAPAGQNTASSGSYSPEIPRNTYSYDPAAASTGGTQPPRPPHDIPGGSQPQKRKMSFLPFLLIAIGVAALVFLLIGVFGNRSGDVYNAVYGKIGLRTVAAEDMWEDGFRIELFSNGKCRATVGDETETCRYELDDDGNIDVLLYDAEMHGTLSGDVIVFENVFDSGMDLYFVREGGSIPAEGSKPVGGQTTEAPAEAPVDTGSDYAWWDGDWYGWWIIESGTGDYALSEGGWWDACAHIDLGEDGSGTLTLWDDSCEAGEYIAQASVQAEADLTTSGRLVSTDGSFLNCPLTGADAWYIDAAAPESMPYHDMICISGVYTDPEGSGSSFVYTIYLRPWGMDWEDVRAADESLLPYYYDDWYLPLIEAGGSMPDQIGEELSYA